MDDLLEDVFCEICTASNVSYIISMRSECGCNRTRFACSACGPAFEQMVEESILTCSAHSSAINTEFITIGGSDVV